MRHFLAVILSAVVAAAQGGLTFSVDVPLVSLDVTVTDSHGKPINTLTKDDFLIYEDDVPHDIQNFSAVDVPYNVLLLFDCSGSAKPQKELMTKAMTRFMDNLRPQDRIAIAQFGSSVDLRVDWRQRGSDAFPVELGTFAGCDNTDFYGAATWAARKLEGVSGRKGVLVYSDGMTQMPQRAVSVAGRGIYRPVDSRDDPGFQAMLQAVRASGAAFHFVAIDTDVNPPAGAVPASIPLLQQARARMEQLADISGGRVSFPRKMEDILPMYERIGHELGSSYSLGYVSKNPAKDGRPRSIIVRLRDETASIRQSRSSY